MALIKEKLTPVGTMADYWRVSRIIVDRRGSDFPCTVTVDLYVSKDARSLGRIPADTMEFNVPVEALKDDAVITSAYAYLKTLSEFKEAVDA